MRSSTIKGKLVRYNKQQKGGEQVGKNDIYRKETRESQLTSPLLKFDMILEEHKM